MSLRDDISSLVCEIYYFSNHFHGRTKVHYFLYYFSVVANLSLTISSGSIQALTGDYSEFELNVFRFAGSLILAPPILLFRSELIFSVCQSHRGQSHGCVSGPIFVIFKQFSRKAGQSTLPRGLAPTPIRYPVSATGRQSSTVKMSSADLFLMKF